MITIKQGIVALGYLEQKSRVMSSVKQEGTARAEPGNKVVSLMKQGLKPTTVMKFLYEVEGQREHPKPDNEKE